MTLRPHGSDGRTWTGGRVWLTVGLVIAVVAAVAGCLSDPDEVRLPGFLTGDDAHVEFPDDWLPHDVASRLPSSASVAVTPDQSSGNWISISRIPLSDAGYDGYTEETFVAVTAWKVDAAGGRITEGPRPVEVAGIRGLEIGVGGMAGSRTATPLEARWVTLFGAQASYSLVVQFDADRRDEMLEAWEAMLATLSLGDTPAPASVPEFDQLLLTDFADGPEPFVTANRDRVVLSVVDGVYRIERLVGGRNTVFGPLAIPTQSVTIIVDVAGTTQGTSDLFGIGCVSNHDTGFIGYGGFGGPAGGFGVVKDGLGVEPVILAEEDGAIGALDESIRQLAITCTVDSYGNAEVTFAINGAEAARITHSDPSITFFTAAELVLLAATEEGFTVDIAQVDAHAPRATDPTHP